MKPFLKILALLFTFSVIIPIETSAQSTAYTWLPINLTVSGRNIQDGVEAYYLLTEIQSEKTVLIKLVNNNSHKVKIEWKDAVFTNSQEWAYNYDDPIKSIIVDANNKISGAKIETEQNALKIKLSDLKVSSENFNKFGMILFKVTHL